MSQRMPKTARAVHANRGVEAKYRKALQRMIAEMHGSVEYWITAAYRKDPPRMVALVELAEDAALPGYVLSQHEDPGIPTHLLPHRLEGGLGKVDLPHRCTPRGLVKRSFSASSGSG